MKLSSAIAAALWVAGFAVVLGGILIPRHGIPGLGVMLGMGGAVLQIRGFFSEHSDCLRQAFEYGRDHERGPAGVRPMR